jgi:hypothetical protein
MCFFRRALKCASVPLFALITIAAGVFALSHKVSAEGTIGLTAQGYTENFDSLGTVGGSALPTGWYLSESAPFGNRVPNSSYVASAGGSAATGALAGDTYNFGALPTLSDRALGTCRGTDVNPLDGIIGASFFNNTGGVITSLTVSYRGEQWRSNGSLRIDRLDFQYSLDATSLTTGTWVDVDSLDFATLMTGNVGSTGNTAGFNQIRTGSIDRTINPGQTFWIRWVDADILGNDDGLAIDNFSITLASTDPTIAAVGASPAAVPVPVTGSNSTVLTVRVVPGANPPSTGVEVVGDLSTIGGLTAQPFHDDGLNGDAFAGDGVFSFRAVVPAAADAGPRSFPVTVRDAQGRSANGAIALIVNRTNPKSEGLASPALLAPGDSGLLTVEVTPGTHPVSTGLRVFVDLSALGGSSAEEFTDTGTNADAAAGDGVFSRSVQVPDAAVAGLTVLDVTVTDAEGRSSGPVPTISFSIDVPTPIHDIQGAGNASPIAGQNLASGGPRGIVTALTPDGFFIQAPLNRYDTDPRTSEGLFVFTSSSPAVSVGDLVWVFGSVEEAQSMTRIVDPEVLILARAQPLPEAVVLTAATISPSGSIDQLEPLEGMRVHVDRLRVVGPTGGTFDDLESHTTSDGVFYGVIDGLPRPFRGAGIPVSEALPAGAPANIARFDENPERLRVNTSGQLSAPALDVTAASLVTNLTGPLAFAGGSYTLFPDVATPPVASGQLTAVPVRERRPAEFSVASLNLGTLSGGSEGPLAKASLAVRTVLRLPDIIGVQEVENLGTLNALAGRINADAALDHPEYVPYLLEGHDANGLNVGFLVKTSRVSVDETPVQIAADVPFGGASGFLFDRPSLLLKATVLLPSHQYPLTVIVNDLLGADSNLDLNVHLRRKLQAEALAAFIHDRQTTNPAEHLLVLGNFNASREGDGFVDVIGTLTGTPAPADTVVFPTTAPGGLTLIDLGALLPAVQRYSVVSQGNAEERDHILLSPSVMPFVAGMQWARSNADFPEIDRNDATRPERVSGHDAPVAFFGDVAPPMLTLPASMTVEATGPTGTSVSFEATARDIVDGARAVTCAPASGATFPLGTTRVSCSTEDASGNTADGSFFVTVVDSLPPVLTLPSGFADVATSPNGAIVSYLAAAADVVDGPVPIVCAPASGSLFGIGTTAVLCSAADANGTAVTGSFQVTITEPATPSQMDGEGRIESASRQHEFSIHARERATGAEAGELRYTLRGAQNGREDRFLSTVVTTVSFYDLPAGQPGRRPRAQVDTVVFTGVGTWNGRAGYTFVAQASDVGEPGRGRDTFSLTISDASGKIVASVAGTLTGGNLQSNRVVR